MWRIFNESRPGLDEVASPAGFVALRIAARSGPMEWSGWRLGKLIHFVLNVAIRTTAWGTPPMMRVSLD